MRRPDGARADPGPDLRGPLLGGVRPLLDADIASYAASQQPSGDVYWADKALMTDEIYQLGAFVSADGHPEVMIPYPSPLASNLCFTGRALHVSMENQPPAWSVTVAYPLDRNVSPDAYRVFGLNESAGVWVQMPSTLERLGSGYELIAHDESVDPNHVVPGAVDGPYALVYDSASACP